MQTTAIRTLANPLPENEVILLTLLISKRYIPYTDLRKIRGKNHGFRQIIAMDIANQEVGSLLGGACPYLFPGLNCLS